MKDTLTSQAILDLRSFQKQVVETLETNEANKMQFFVGDLKVENSKLVLDGNTLSDDSTKKVLSHLRVRPNFLELQKKMSEEDWESVSHKLQYISAQQPVYARKATGLPQIVDLQLASKKAPNGGILVPEIFDAIYENLVSSSADDYVLSDKFYDEEKGIVSVTLLNSQKEIDVFGTQEDMWKTGKIITFSDTEFGIHPFFERLVCTNGNVAKQYGFSTNVTKSKYNFSRINAMLERDIMNASDSANSILSDATKHLKKTNVSVRELLEYRNFFNEEAHSKILEKYFDLSYLNKVYRCDVEGMHNIWKSTADTGRNAYDFINDLTYIASHPKETGIDEISRRQLQITASNLIFKETLDLELVAPKITSWK